mmetsp:Transcript_5020/g.7670  ORF Transcript_5020/g.7670 Transcript_5020/m.7670 type:complete len:616 (-) Transcript_5020:149-1996(-)|eukprot:CAMPEP_0185020796 /NCGR_PEP_ID=MMETSP1103-20130426/3435_1 /TAXON_ID=36769 /ORGANISM="Paraphysomonas bandaiensis, Strain Caron Lab Isolate" /LENGTH=615 /DNA_ID=CAMNT_0027551913 /DNA_START=76 /DNA_END=1923 /DNA_ORIENTATION=-
MFYLLSLWIYLISIPLTHSSDIISRANSLYNDPNALLSLYSDHIKSKQQSHERSSKLSYLLEDIHEYAINSVTNSSRKHIVTILTDDMGWMDIGYNDPTFVSPTADFMANEGIKLNNFYVQCTCSPTRASLLTGRAVTKTGLQDGAIIPGESRSLPLNLPTAGNYFKEADYTTYFIGKWHLGNKYMNLTANARGYDYYFGLTGGAIGYYKKDLGLMCQGTEENNHMPVFAENCTYANAYDLNENGTPYVEDLDKYVTDILADKAVDAIVKHDNSKPMLMHLHFNGPHTPLHVPQKLFDLCEGVSEGTPAAVQPYFRQQLCGMVASVDIATLRVLLALTANRMIGSTLFVYHSDNGGLEQAGSVNAPFRSQKGAVFEGGIHVPAFMYGNGLRGIRHLTPTRDDLFDVSDVLPTLLGYAGVSTPPGTFDGYNHWKSLSTGLPMLRRSIALNSASESLGYYSAYIEIIFGSTWKYLLNPSVVEFIAVSSLGDTYEPEGEFLFNLSEDPYETTNLAESSDIKTTIILNYLRLRTLLMQVTSAPSQLTQFPPVLDSPPSPLGCWLPLDSPLFSTFKCPVPPPVFPPVSDDTTLSSSATGFMGGLGVEDQYDYYVTCDLDL